MTTLLATKKYTRNERTRYGLMQRAMKVEIKKRELQTGRTVLDFMKWSDNAVVEEFWTSDPKTIQRLESEYGFIW